MSEFPMVFSASFERHYPSDPAIVLKLGKQVVFSWKIPQDPGWSSYENNRDLIEKFIAGCFAGLFAQQNRP